MKVLVVLFVMFFISACTDPKYKEADGKVLCDPDSKQAYVVTYRSFENSSIKPLNNVNEDVCK